MYCPVFGLVNDNFSFISFLQLYGRPRREAAAEQTEDARKVTEANLPIICQNQTIVFDLESA